jgi:hypothetical protein
VRGNLGHRLVALVVGRVGSDLVEHPDKARGVAHRSTSPSCTAPGGTGDGMSMSGWSVAAACEVGIT